MNRDINRNISFALIEPFKEDALFIYNLREEISIKQFSFHPEPLSFEKFYQTFSYKYFSIKNLPSLYLLFQGEKVGVFSFKECESPFETPFVEISVFLDKKIRGQGIGFEALQRIKELIFFKGFSGIVAKVRRENGVSSSFFKKGGFECVAFEEELVSDTLKTYQIEKYLLLNPERKEQKPCFIIAEAGSNWKAGSFEEDLLRSKKLIKTAAQAGANAVKFQVFRGRTTYAKNAGSASYLESEGKEGEIESLFKNLEMPYEMIPLLASFAEEENIEWMASVFSLEDFKAVDPFVKRHKIASYEIGFFPLIEAVAKSKKPLILSTGASEMFEIEEAVSCFKRAGGECLTLLQCTAKYPASLSSVNLTVLPQLKQKFGVSVGLSDHTLSPVFAPLGASIMGASLIEKHFTLDKTFEGPDHSFALNPGELEEMVKVIRKGENLRGSPFKKVQKEEEELFLFAKRGLQAISPLKKGEVLRFGANIDFLRPGKNNKGISLSFLERVEGKKIKKEMKEGEGIVLEWIED